MNSANTRENLLKLISNKRHSIKSFLSNLEPTGTRLTNFNIICGSFATVLTAASAFEGKTVIEALNKSYPNSPVWRFLFLVPAAFSLASTIAAAIYKSQDIASRLGKAEACDAKLEGLEALLKVDQITLKDAVTQYTQFISEIPFVSGERSSLLPSYIALDKVKGEILKPRSNQVVGETIPCSVSVEDLDAGIHLWLAVEIGGRIWPKESELALEEDGTWRGKIKEQGKTEAFSLSLFAANSKANQRIRAWLDRGDATGKYEELWRLPDTRRIASVDGLHRKKAS